MSREVDFLRRVSGLFLAGWLFAAVPPAWAQSAGTLKVGSAAGAPGESVTVPIFLDTQGTEAQSVQLILTCDGTVLTRLAAEPASGLPKSPWVTQIHSPKSGEIRLIAVDFSGQGKKLAGEIFQATFTIDSKAQPGPLPITVSLAKVHDRKNTLFALEVAHGTVTVLSPPS